MVRHIVSWNFKPELSEGGAQGGVGDPGGPDDRTAGSGALRGEAGGVSAPIGLSNCDLCMYTEIDKEENLVVYRDHPEHQKVVKLIHQWCCDRRCTDMPM